MKRDSDGNALGKEKPVGKQGSLGSRGDAEFRGYVNYNLSDEQKATYAAWAEGQGYYETLEASVESGVNLSLKLDPKGGGFLASATQRNPASPNAGLVVTARGRDAVTAWGRVVFVLALLSHKPRWEDTQRVADPDRW